MERKKREQNGSDDCGNLFLIARKTIFLETNDAEAVKADGVIVGTQKPPANKRP